MSRLVVLCGLVAFLPSTSSAAVFLSISTATGLNTLDANSASSQYIDLFAYSDTPIDALNMGLDVSISGNADLKFATPSLAVDGGVGTVWESDFTGVDGLGLTELDGLGEADGPRAFEVFSSAFLESAAISTDMSSPSFVARFLVDTSATGDSTAFLNIIDNPVARASSFTEFDGVGEVVTFFSNSFELQIGAGAAVPEPSSFALMALGGFAWFGIRRRRQNSTAQTA